MPDTTTIPPYVLTAAQFTSLARGHGTPDAIATLVAGQATTRRLLLFALIDKLRSAGLTAPPCSDIEAALNTLAAAEARDPAAFARVLTAPRIAAWASFHLLRLNPAAVSELVLLTAAAALQARTGYQLTVVSPDGNVTLPTLGVATGMGTGAVRLTFDGTTLTCSGASGTTRVVAPFESEQDGWLPVRHVGGQGVPVVAVDDLDPHRDAFGYPVHDRLTPSEVDTLRRMWRDAWYLLTAHHPQHVQAITTIVSTLVPLAPPTDGQSLSAASRQAFGAVALTLPERAATLVEALIHETQHLKLGAVLDLADLYRPGGQAIHYAPWRPDPRGVGPLLQGCYAHLGVTDFWRGHRVTLTGVERALADFEFALWCALVADGIDSVLQSGELTGLGSRFVSEMAGTLAQWRAEPVPQEPARLAHDVALAYRVRWHLTRTTSRAGAPPPTLADAARLWLTDRDRVADADRCLFGRDYARAAELYEHDVATTGDPDAHAALAVARHHLESLSPIRE